MIDPRTAAMQDRARQLRVGDWVVLEDGFDVGTVLPGSEIAAVRRARKAIAGVEIALRLDGGHHTSWIDAAHCPAVHDSNSFLGHRFRAATKVCTTCLEPYPLSGFYRDPGMRDVRFKMCCACWCEYSRARQQARKAARAAADGVTS